MGDSIEFNDSVLKFPGIDKSDPGWGGFSYGAQGDDHIRLWEGGPLEFRKDMVNSPAHYTKGKQEAIEIIEEAIQDAPSMKQAYAQGQVLKYLLRLWLKDNPKEDAEKARWYLNRLIDSL